MPRPTLIQTILGRPSQSYTLPVTIQRTYHSTKPELFRLYTHDDDNNDDIDAPSARTPVLLPTLTDKRSTDPLPPTVSTQRCLDSEVDAESDSDLDVFFTPNTSPNLKPSLMAPSNPVPFASTTSLASSSESLSVDSVFSSASLSPSETTRATSPPVSDSGRHSPRKRSQPRPIPDSNWAKEVRWLVPRSPGPQSLPPVSFSKPKSHTRCGCGPHKRLTAPPIPSIMMSMTALLEEDEYTPSGPLGGRHTTPPSYVILDPRARHTSEPLAPSSWTPSRSNLSRNSTLSTHSRSHSISISHPHLTSPGAGPSRRHSLSTPPHHQPPSLPSHGTPGFTSLTLPRAPPPPTLPLTPTANTGLNGRVDLTLGGIAQTTMATIEIVRGLGASSANNGIWASLARRRSVDCATLNQNGKSRADHWADSPLGFTPHRTPPNYVSPNSVIVQVWAVAVDGVDAMLVAEKSGMTGNGKGKAEVGYIPGRSFVGRVVERGCEVDEKDVGKGEWVMGLLDVRKCGALAEFIVVDRHRCQRIPFPRMKSPSKRPATFISSSPTLTLAEYARLPLCAVPAHRAVRTCLSTLSNASTPTSRPRRALVLRGHDGTGAVAAQMFIRHGWHVCVHAPLSSNANPDDRGGQSIEACVRAWGADGVVFDDGSEQSGGGGGGGAAVRVMERLIEDGDVFDAIVDTIGGREVWEAGSRLLKAGGRGGAFVTLVGDVVERAVPSAGDHFRAGMRSLRRSSLSRNGGGGGREVGYAWLSIAQDVDWYGEDVRESLGAVLKMALEGSLLRTGMVVPFERSPDIFVNGASDSSPLGSGRTVVVTVVP